MKKEKQKTWLRMDAESARILRQPTTQEKKLNRTRKGLSYQTAQKMLGIVQADLADLAKEARRLKLEETNLKKGLSYQTAQPLLLASMGGAK